jgi:peptidoglycan hydrolase-like protein with peptidoglycan-binding domain
MSPRSSVIGAVAVVAVGATAAVAAGALSSDDPPAAPAAGERTSTASVERRTLVDRESVDGTYGYGDTRPLLNRLAAAGTLTSAAGSGRIVRRGDVLYRVDTKPVVLMYGAKPAWRDLAAGVSDGADVLQLERNLRKLGYGEGMAVDDHFDSDTTAAVGNWQDDAGLPETGTVELGRVVFLPGARRVASRQATVGAPLPGGATVLTLTSTARVVAVDLDVSKQSLVHAGDAVTITLPDGDDVPGKIRTVGRVAKAGSGSGDNSGSATIAMTVSLTSRRGLQDLDQAPVTVNIATDARKSVVSVPVTALLARQGGGYGVEVVGADGKSTIRPVQTGLFAGGYVEVAGVGEGDRVAVPQ